MKYLKYLTYLLIVVLTTVSFSSCEKSTEEIDMTENVLGHLSDSYEWHICTINGHHISVPLLVIVKSQRDNKWHLFSSSRFHDSEDGVYEGFYIDRARQGKVYEKGIDERPLDFSFTRDALQIWLNAILLIVVFLTASRWYKRHNNKTTAPKGFVGMLEVLTMAINDDVIKASIGEKNYKPYAPYLLTIFFFILTCNLVGLIPIFPAGSNITGNISVTFLLAFMTLIVINVFGNKVYWKEILWPDVPMMMKFPIPLMPFIELFSIFTKPFALMIRLFANMFGGHAVIISLTCIIFITWQISAGLGASMSAVSFILVLFMNLLELLVAFIQAYVFTILSAVFIGLAHQEHEDV